MDLTEEEWALARAYQRNVRKKLPTTPEQKRAWSLRVTLLERAKKERDPEAYRAEVRERGVRARSNGSEGARQKRANDKCSDVLAAIKRHAGCADCGNKALPPECYDFDHLSDKSFSIGPKRRLAFERILDEIAKCEVVCANCHRVRTRKRMGVLPAEPPRQEKMDHAGRHRDRWAMARARGLLPQD